jgi:carbamoylphosphate synthase small subunit
MKISEEQKKGVEILSKILNKRYPFITDVIINESDFDEYVTILSLKCVVNKKYLEKYFNKKIKYFWNEFWTFDNVIPTADLDSKILTDIRDIGENFYKIITEEYQFNSTLSTLPFRKIKISSFLLK